MSVIYVNGEFVNALEAKISVYDRSFLFGEGLFESFRSHDGKVPFLSDHIGRLEWSSTFLNIEFPGHLNFAEICEKLLQKNNIKDARFKVSLSQEGTSFTDSKFITKVSAENGLNTQIVIYCEPLNIHNVPETYKLKTIKHYQNDPLPLAAMKTTNYLVKIMARQDALESGFNDGILLNSRGNVTETCTGNICWIDKDAKLWTVMDEQGLLSGIMQKKLLEILAKNKINSKPGIITPEELSSSREVFVTNSVVGIKPVTTIDSRQISGGEIGSITAMIKDVWTKEFETILNT